jgi:hypothetical protein
VTGSRSRNAAILALILAVACAAGSSALLAPRADALVSISTLSAIEGAVLISRAGGDFASAREGDVVAAGDTIRTGARASVEITFFEGSSVRVGADTALVVASLPTSERGAMQTLARVRHVVTELISGGSRYETRGPSWTASVRG